MDQAEEYVEVNEEILQVEEQFLERLPDELPETFINRTLKLLRSTDPNEEIQEPPVPHEGEEDEFPEERKMSKTKRSIQMF